MKLLIFEKLSRISSIKIEARRGIGYSLDVVGVFNVAGTVCAVLLIVGLSRPAFGQSCPAAAWIKGSAALTVPLKQELSRLGVTEPALDCSFITVTVERQEEQINLVMTDSHGRRAERRVVELTTAAVIIAS